MWYLCAHGVFAGPFLVKKIQAHFKSKSVSVNVKYIDPSYTIRRSVRG